MVAIVHSKHLIYLSRSIFKHSFFSRIVIVMAWEKVKKGMYLALCMPMLAFVLEDYVRVVAPWGLCAWYPETEVYLAGARSWDYYAGISQS